MKEIAVGMHDMTLEDLSDISRMGATVRLTEGSKNRIKKSRDLIEKWVREERSIYGVTTGFGVLSDVAISRKDTRKLQENILMSHAAGVGKLLDEETVRAIMALRIKDLARGHSGIRLETVEHLITLLNQGICPVVPEKGSVGASGDLIPLAHLSLVLIGQGEAFYKEERISGLTALKRCGIKPLRLEAAEGLALINGTQVMTAVGALSVFDALNLSSLTDIAAACPGCGLT